MPHLFKVLTSDSSLILDVSDSAPCKMCTDFDIFSDMARAKAVTSSLR